MLLPSSSSSATRQSQPTDTHQPTVSSSTHHPTSNKAHKASHPQTTWLSTRHPSPDRVRKRARVSSTHQPLHAYQQAFCGTSDSTLLHLSGKSSPVLSRLKSTFTSLANLHQNRPPWHADLPTHSELLRTPFGQPSSNYSFTQEASFETSLFTILKSGYLDIASFSNLCLTHPLVEHLATMIPALATVDFRSLREHDPNWATITAIPSHVNLRFLALLFHFDCHLSAAVRYLGGKYLGGHRDIKTIIPKLRPHVDPETIEVFQRVMTTGCPAHFNAETTRSNAMTYLRHGNSSSVSKHQSLVASALLKEYRNNYAVPLPSWVARFLRHVFFTPIHILDKPGRAPRLVFDALKRHEPTSQSVNNMTSTHSGCEMDCAYGDVLLRLLTRIWNLRITYPDQDIVLHCNDVKSCFR